MLNQNRVRKLQPTTWVSILLLILVFPLGISLPTSWGWENGLIENTQLVIICGCVAATCLTAYHNRDDRKVYNCWLWLTIFWFLLIGRELNWGRVWFPVSIGEAGPVFIPSSQLWYTPLVRVFIAGAIIALVIGICRNNPVKCLRQVNYSLSDVIILFLTSILVVLFEKKVFAFFNSYGEILEELAELTAYWAMFSIIVINLRSLKRKKPKKIPNAGRV